MTEDLTAFSHILQLTNKQPLCQSVGKPVDFVISEHIEGLSMCTACINICEQDIPIDGFVPVVQQVLSEFNNKLDLPEGVSVRYENTAITMHKE